MAENEISEDLRRLIFERIDSVEQLEVLILLKNHKNRSWSSEQVSVELRSTPLSVAGRLVVLKRLGLLQVNESECYQYSPTNNEIEDLTNKLIEVYRIKPHKVLELIFSPLKKVRNFADAFVVTKKGTDNG